MGMTNLQEDLHEWRKHNFPDSDSEQQLLGIVEEVGELAHAHLKQKQGIRGRTEDHEAEAQDAIGDLTIYMMGYCSYRGWNFKNLVHDVATGVMARDWIKFPKDGYNE